ncbi:MAG: DUF2339 domain-containing protein [Coriobacteriia bacterium]|nr:DUF2339 domain-containing protein [Coriobacteriia bacterium]
MVDFILFMLMVSVLVTIIISFSKINALQEQIGFLTRAIEMLQHSIGLLNSSYPKRDTQQAPSPIPRPMAPSDGPIVDAARPAWEPPQAQQQFDRQPLPVQQPIPAQFQQQPMPAQLQQQPMPVQPQPMPAPQPTLPVPANQPEVAAKRSYETFFGRNVIGIIASVLVFIGLIFLGFLVVPYFNDAVKILLMFSLSAGLSAGGYLTNKRYSNNFTKALLGTGCGAFFISIQMTHLYFNAINEIVCYILLLAWIVASMLLARQSESLLVGIIAHVGMVFSTCAGYSFGLIGDKLVLLLGYQLLSSAAIVVGNIYCSRKLVRLGLFATLSLTLYASAVMSSEFDYYFFAHGASQTVVLVSVAFVIQFLTASFLAYLLFVSIIRTKSRFSLLMQSANLLLWFFALMMNINRLVEKLFGRLGSTATNYYLAILVAMILTLVIIYTAVFVLVSLRKTMKFDYRLELLSNTLLFCISVILLMYLCLEHLRLGEPGPNVIYLVLPAGLCLLAEMLSTRQASTADNMGTARNISSTYSITALGILAFDSLYMCLQGYMELMSFGTELLALLYLAITLVLSFLAYRRLNQNASMELRRAYKITVLVYFQIAAASIFWRSYLQIGNSVFYLICLLTLLAFQLFGEDSPRAFFKVNEYILMIGLCLDFSAHGLKNAGIFITLLHLVAVACALFIILNRIRLLTQTKSRQSNQARPTNQQAPAEPAALFEQAPPPSTSRFFIRDDIEFFSGLAIHCLALSTVQGLTGWLDYTYTFGLVSMIVALVIVTLGFWSWTRSLRLYGLAVVILCVLKLVLIDMSGLETIMRVIAFIGGGIICFGVSALYNFAVKRYQTERFNSRE